jgi:protein ImuA
VVSGKSTILSDKSSILAQLQRDILPLQGLKKANGNPLNIGWGSIDLSFPDKTFPVGAVHEFISAVPEDKAATSGFVAGILKALMKNGGTCIWISASRTLFPPALRLFGVEPHHIIFVDLQKEKDILWVMEESLKCPGLGAVIGELSDLSFTASRRLQLAVEQSCVTGFVLRHQPRNLNTNACVTRWKISSLASNIDDEMPGLGFPNWNVELIKVRNGKPGSWQIGWEAGKFRNHSGMISLVANVQKKKVG